MYGGTFMASIKLMFLCFLKLIMIWIVLPAVAIIIAFLLYKGIKAMVKAKKEKGT